MPTNLGALLVRKSCVPVLHKSYFGGGTVAALTIDEPWHAFRRNISERLEDGTPPFMELLAIECGFNCVDSLFGSWDDIAAHTQRVIQYTMPSR
jgi:molybdenum cofactor sulfurtransferase